MLAKVLLAAIEIAAEAAAGARGERRASATVHGEGDDGSWSIAVESAAGGDAPLRHAMTGALDRGGFLAEGRVVPGGEGLWLAAGALGFKLGPFAITARGKLSHLGSAGLRGAGARVDWEHELSESTRAGIGAEAWALWLSKGFRGDPWLGYGQRTLDWSQRGSLSGWLAHDFGILSAAPSLEIVLPPKVGAVEARLAASLEVPLGSWKLRAQAAVSWAAVWLYEAGAGLARSWP